MNSYMTYTANDQNILKIKGIMNFNFFKKLGRRNRIILIIFSIACLFAAAYMIYMDEFSNFHTVKKNELYRSSAMDMDELEYFLPKYNIKSVINLRGKPKNDVHFTDEMEIIKRLGIEYYELNFASTKAPTPKDIEQLMSAFDKAGKPILIHCEAGSDRTGLACAIWKLCIEKDTREDATRQLSIRYGHIAIGETSVLDDFFKDFRCAGNKTP